MLKNSSILVTSYTADGGVNDGKHVKVNHFDNGLYTSTNKAKLVIQKKIKKLCLFGPKEYFINLIQKILKN